MDEGEVVGSEPVVARRHPTTLFDPVEEPFDLVASTIEIGAEADRIAAVAFRRVQGVDHLDSGIMGGGKRFYDAAPNTGAPPPDEAIVARGVWAKRRRQIAVLGSPIRSA